MISFNLFEKIKKVVISIYGMGVQSTYKELKYRALLSDSGGIFATLTLRTELIIYTSSCVMVQFRWKWNKAPVQFRGKEIVGFAWNGTDTAGRLLNVKINTSSVYVKANKIPSKWYYPVIR